MIIILIRIFVLILMVGILLLMALMISGNEKIHRLYKKFGPWMIGFSLIFSFVILMIIFVNSENTHKKNDQYLPAYFDEYGNLVERNVKKNDEKI